MILTEERMTRSRDTTNKTMEFQQGKIIEFTLVQASLEKSC
jgi:hypothetical protein